MRKKIEKTEKFGLIYEAKAHEMTFKITNLKFLLFKNLIKKNILKLKIVRPNNLLSGQMDNDLNVGDKNNKLDKTRAIFLFFV